LVVALRAVEAFWRPTNRSLVSVVIGRNVVCDRDKALSLLSIMWGERHPAVVSLPARIKISKINTSAYQESVASVKPRDLQSNHLI